MFCANCGARIDDPDQKYCELCGNEITNINDTPKEKTKVKTSTIRSKRRCC